MTDDACNNQLAAGASAANRDLSASTTAGQREAAPVKEAGLGGVGLLDLTGVHSLDDLVTMGHIRAVGTALVPEAFLARFTTLPIGGVGDLVVVPTPVGGKVKVRKGHIQMSGEALARGTGNPADILVVNGRLVITSPAEAVGYQQLIVVGQLLAPASSRPVLEAALSCLIGEGIFYREPFRLFTADTHFDQAFFELLEGPMNLVLLGHASLESDVTVDLLRAKVAEITLVGTLTAPKSLVPVLQLLATTNVGTIEVEKSRAAHGE